MFGFPLTIATDPLFLFSHCNLEEKVEEERVAAAHKACKPLNSKFEALLTGILAKVGLGLEHMFCVHIHDKG